MTGLANQAGGLRTPPLPVEHLMAELLAAPLSSNAGFAGAIVELDPKLAPTPKGMSSTMLLWRQTEQDLLSRFPGMSVDDLVLRRDRLWFGKPGDLGTHISLDQMLGRCAREVIAVDSGVARMRIAPDFSESRQRRFWRWLTFSIPCDLVLAAVGASSEHPQFLNSNLQGQLADNGLAEPHLHLKAAITFPLLWSSLMRVLASPASKSSMLGSPGAEWDEGQGLTPLLLTCALARLLLAEFLALSAFQRGGLWSFFNDHVAPRLRPRFGASSCAFMWQSIFALANGQKPVSKDFVVLRNLYAQMIGPNRPTRPTRDLDPLCYWYPSTSDMAPDFRFTCAALAYLRGLGRNDLLFAKIFWQIVRARLLFYRHVVQRPMVPGLQWFTRTYARLSPARRAIPLGEFVQQAASLAGEGLQALEIRLTPERSINQLVSVVGTIERAAKGLENPSNTEGMSTRNLEVGLIFHFSRTRGQAAEAGRPAAWSRAGNDDPEAVSLNPSGYRYSGYYREQRASATALAAFLQTFPRTLERVRGIDLCTDELGVPLWVLTPLVQHVLHAGDRAAAHLHKTACFNKLEAKPRPLGVTVHAGEDFVHLLGGIRRVHEAIQVLGLGEGARIGHAVALGIDVLEWAQRTRNLYLPAGERIFDMLWLRRVALLAPQDFHPWLQWIDHEIARLGKHLFSLDLLPMKLEEWWQHLHDPKILKHVGFPDGPPPRNLDVSAYAEQPSSLKLVYKWLTDRTVFRRAQELQSINVESEIPLLQAVQDYVRNVIRSRGIYVEINPSSNLLIGHLGDLNSHPLWRLCPPPGTNIDGPAVRVCIGSDDPITFATKLTEEYQLLADALSDAGVPASDIDAWLDAARKSGLTSRFTVPRSNRALTNPMRIGTYPGP